MEIISKTTEVQGLLAPIFFMIVFILLVIMFVYIRNELSETETGVFEGFLCILFAITITLWVFLPIKIEKYRLRVNDSVTAKELTETYEIVEYDKDTDLWIVKEKENTNESK